MADINEELRVLVTAEVDKAIKNLKNVDKQTDSTTKAFKLLGKSISAAFVAKTVIDFSKACANAYREHDQAVSVLNSTLEATGATAWTTSAELQNMAKELQSATNYTADSINQMQSILLGFRNIQGENFSKATSVILNAATTMGQNINSVAQSIGKALDDPIHGMDSLQKQGFKFTESQKKVMQSLIDAGDAASAQKYVLDELDKTYGESAKAAADSATQIKNAWSDILQAYGRGYAEAFDSIFKGKDGKNKIVEGMEEFAEWVETGFDDWHRKLDFQDWYGSMSDTEKLEEARLQLELWLKTYDKYVTSSLPGSTKKLENAKEEVKIWQNNIAALEQTIEAERKATQQENERADAEAAINDLMLEISKNYEKLGKDDPTVQLKNYQKELDEIKKKRVELSKEVLDSDGKIIDTSEALAQLDYVEKKIREKIKALNDDGKKTWKQFWEDATGITAGSFKTGKEAGELYINGLRQSLEDKKELSNLLGNDFDFTAAIEDQMSEVEGVITQLLSIPAEKINEVYSTADASVQKLIDYYRSLNDQKKAFEASDIVKALEDEYARLLMTDEEIVKAEQDAVIAKLENVKADEQQIERAKELLGLIQEQKEARKEDEDSIKSWDDFLEKKIGSAVEKLQLFKENVEESNKIVTDLGISLANIAIDGAVTGFKELGQALAEGKDAGDSMQQALVSMASEILNQLPLLFMQAGLQLIAQGQWPLGLGLMAAGLGDAVIARYVNGKTQSSKANALGAVYGDEAYSAFAKGGTFTNQVVAKPTYFRFAKGSGFGTGLMGEAGPEAIMPLTRGADGSLGVSASGISGGDVQVNIPVTVYSDEPVEVHDTEDENGQRKIEILVGSMINQHIAGGKADRALKGRYGLRPQGV